MVSSPCQRHRAAPRLPCPVIDRASLENLLHLSRRSAIRLNECLRRLPGRPHLPDRPRQLISALERIRDGEDFWREGRRRRRLAEDLERTGRDLKARRVKLPVSSDKVGCFPTPRCIGLPDRGYRSRFSSAEALLATMFELVQDAANDLEAFERSLEVRT